MPGHSFSDRAVSESISFVLLTAILLIAFFVIYLTGLPVYNSYIDQSHMSNIEQSFDIIAYNGNTVAMYQSPFSSSELKVFGGWLATRESGYMNISYYGAGGNLIGYNNTTLTMLEYTKNTDRVAYVDGSVCRYYPDGSVMLGEPEVFSSPDSLIVPMITIFNSNVSVAGQGLTRISFLTPYYSKMSQTIAVPSVASFPVRKVIIALNGDYARPFGQYFTETHGFTQSAGPGGEVILTKTYPSDVKLQITQSYITVQAS